MNVQSAQLENLVSFIQLVVNFTIYKFTAYFLATANVQGSVKESDCLRCPAGKNAEEEGQRLCKCITADSCDFTFAGETFFSNDVDYYRKFIDLTIALIQMYHIIYV